MIVTVRSLLVIWFYPIYDHSGPQIAFAVLGLLPRWVTRLDDVIDRCWRVS